MDERWINEVKNRNDIAEVIGEYISLQSKGGSLKGLCPFHHEKTPSFHVNRRDQYYYCFGCHAKGDVIRFVQEMDRLEFMDALKKLARRAGMPWPTEASMTRKDIEKAERRKKLLEIQKKAARFFYQQLKDHPASLAYLFRRGLKPKTVSSFGLGYAPFGNKLLEAFSKEYEETLLVESGLVQKSEKGLRDRFIHRIMYPIFDVHSNVIAFGGRAIDDAYGPKYLNSAESPVFSKKHNLYALNFAKRNFKDNPIILAEGYMDVIALHQYGFSGAVASLGTAFTQEQGALLKRYDAPVYICYDSDRAGQSATLKAAQVLKQLKIPTFVISLGGSKDPDDYLKQHGEERFRDCISNALTPLSFELTSRKDGYDLTKESQKHLFIAEVGLRLKKELEEGNYIEVEELVKAYAADLNISIRSLGQEVYGKFFSPRQFDLSSGSDSKSTDQTDVHPPNNDLLFDAQSRIRQMEEKLLLALEDYPERYREYDRAYFYFEDSRKRLESWKKEVEEGIFVIKKLNPNVLNEQELNALVRGVRRATYELELKDLERRMESLSKEDETASLQIASQILIKKKQIEELRQ